jgi:hypothetical protein
VSSLLGTAGRRKLVDKTAEETAGSPVQPSVECWESDSRAPACFETLGLGHPGVDPRGRGGTRWTRVSGSERRLPVGLAAKAPVGERQESVSRRGRDGLVPGQGRAPPKAWAGDLEDGDVGALRG